MRLDARQSFRNYFTFPVIVLQWIIFQTKVYYDVLVPRTTDSTRNICLVTPLNITIRHSNSVPVQYTFSIFRTPSQLIRYKFNNLVHLFSTIHLFGTLSRYIHSVYLFGKSILHYIWCTFSAHLFSLEQIYLVRFSIQLCSTNIRYDFSVQYVYSLHQFITSIW